MSNTSISVKKRADYRAPDYVIQSVDLEFNLSPTATRVQAISKVIRQVHEAQPLVLDGEGLTLVSVQVDGSSYSDYAEKEGQLLIYNLPEQCELLIQNEIVPANNTSLEGLYYASGAFCTQCEAEGFRKITYFLDRPDVLAEYTVTIFANKTDYPYLLCNGNKVAQGELENDVHWVKWHDPFKKPCYLFALVAGKFDLLEDQYVTKSGRNVALQLFVDPGMANRGQHALESLKKAMAWDEKVFGLEYDLDIYMIVAVDFFNMGAMENKGLNVFNSKFVLANSDTATDDDYFNIESVIAHEYFHNWTGNRVTCRDWFQLSLKEGLTVFRDQQFSADMTSAVVNRIKNVKVIREHQFAEDASAMSHPIRPDEVIEMNNFYTVTVYDKGAEVIRMMHTLLGADGFRKGMDLYFERHDGQAVTCDDFVNAMQDANCVDFSQFKRWYSQSGTPQINVTEEYDSESQNYKLNITQQHTATADQSVKQDLHIPLAIELINDDAQNQTFMFELSKHQHTFEQPNVVSKPTASLLGNFSAPVKLSFPHNAASLSKIALHSEDGFSRWDAVQQLFSHYIHSQTPAVEDQHLVAVSLQDIMSLIDGLISNPDKDMSLFADMLTLPSFETLTQQVSKLWVEPLYNARKALYSALANEFAEHWETLYKSQAHVAYRYDNKQVQGRKLRNTALSYLAQTQFGEKLISAQFSRADNMTDSLGALKAAQHASLNQFDSLMFNFEQKWQHDPLVLDKWFALHAGAHRNDILARLDLLKSHKQYKINNPNRVRSVVGTFAFYNPMGFHNADGSGYQFVADYLLQLDKINPQVSARIVTPLTQWRGLDDSRKDLMKVQLARLLNEPSLSKDVFEKVSKSLNYNSENSH